MDPTRLISNEPDEPDDSGSRTWWKTLGDQITKLFLRLIRSIHSKVLDLDRRVAMDLHR